MENSIVHNKGVAATAAESRYQSIKRITLIGSVVDLLLGVAKIVGGWFVSSQSLIADGVHSLSDLFTDFIVLFAAKHGSKEPDEDHPYGHGRFETIATVILGVSLLLVAVGIAWDAIYRLFNPELLLHPGVWALAIAAVSVIAKEVIFQYTLRVARRVRSHMLEANAWHSRSDAISSVVVMVGVGGTLLGLNYLDAIAAVGVALMIAKIGIEMTWNSFNELSDKGLNEEQLQVIRDAILQQAGALHVHNLRSRRMGHNALVDVHVQVDSRLTVSEGHKVALAVEHAVKDCDLGVSDVTVHIDPEDDQAAENSENLPDREAVLTIIAAAWHAADVHGQPYRVALHYLSGHIDVDLYIPEALMAKTDLMRQLRHALRQKLQSMTGFGRLQFFAVLEKGI